MTTSFPIDDPPVGFRFRPTDEELGNHYLKNKLLGNDNIVNKAITELEFCMFEPWELPAMSKIKYSDDQEWFFVCPYDYKYSNSKKFNRATNCGFWKPTGKDRDIKIKGNKVGIKKTLVYYNKSCVPKSVKTNWIFHEYHDVTFEDNQRTFVICRLMNKAENKDEDETNIMICDDNENQETTEGISNAEKYLPFSTQRSSIYENEQEVSISNSQLHNAYFGKSNIVDQRSFETLEEEEEMFVNSMLIDGELFTS